MNETNNPTDPALPGAEQSAPASGGEAAVAESLSLAELNQYLGKDFKDKATALKAVKDTFSYVGKKQEAVQPLAPAGSPELEAKVRSLEDEIFYANNPEYKEHRAIIKAMGGNPAEVVGSEAFKSVYEKVKVADEVQKTKSVVSSNSRIAQPSSSLDSAVKAANAGRTDAMMESLTAGIIEELGLR